MKTGAVLDPAPAAEAPVAGVRRVLANVLALLLAYALPRAALFASAIVAARVLGAAGFGAYGTAAAFAVIMSIVATLGMQPLLVRELARSPSSAGSLLRAATLVKTVSNAVMLPLLVVLAAGPLGYGREVVTAALLLGAGYAVGAYVENLAAYYQAVERMHVWTQASALFGAVTASLGAVLVLTTRSPVWFAAAPIAGQVAALGWLLGRLPRDVRRGNGRAGRDAARLARALAPFAAAFVALTLYYKVDVLLLAAWRSASDVGIYTAAYKLVDGAQALVIVVAAAVYPRLARSAPAGRVHPDGWAAARVAELLLLLSVPAAAMVILCREPIVALLYGSGYSAAAPVLGVLAAATVPLGFNIFAGYALGAAGRMRDVALVYGFGLASNVMLNAVLIPRSGPAGAALAMLISESAVTVGLAVALHRRTGARIGFGALTGVASAVAAAIVIAASTPAPLIRVVVCLGAVVVLYTLLDVVPRPERALLRNALRATRAP
jgi:O-antigen/teichoic acid export membrane protein